MTWIPQMNLTAALTLWIEGELVKYEILFWTEGHFGTTTVSSIEIARP